MKIVSLIVNIIETSSTTSKPLLNKNRSYYLPGHTVCKRFSSVPCFPDPSFRSFLFMKQPIIYRQETVTVSEWVGFHLYDCTITSQYSLETPLGKILAWLTRLSAQRSQAEPRWPHTIPELPPSSDRYSWRSVGF